MIRAQMFEKKMKRLPMVMMAQMTEFMKKNIVAQNGWKADKIEIQIDIVLARTAAPVG